jgi:hypothetical protein
VSAPVSHDPLVVNTSDGAVWMRRAVTRDGRGLYAVADAPACCPPFVMATLAELAEHGIAGSADALPVPVGPERRALSAKRLAEIRSLDLLSMMDDRHAAVVGRALADLLGQVERLLAERHSTNEALSEAAEALRRQRDRITGMVKQREVLAERLRAGQHWERGRNPELVSENYVSQSELREIFGIPLVAPWDEDPCRPCGCPKRFDRHAEGCPTLPAEAGGGQ